MAAEGWYAVQTTLPRTGRNQIVYVQASSSAQAANSNPGSTVLGGPYTSESAAAKAWPQGSAGSVPPVAGQANLPTISETPTQLPTVGGLFSGLFSWATRGFAIRALKVGVGVILMIVGVVQLTHAQTLIKTVAGAAAVA